MDDVRDPSRRGDELTDASLKIFWPSPVVQRSRNPACLSVPDHELLRLIASGAYGEVWLARNVVGTLRAVKIVRRDQHELAESFDREFKGLQKFEPISRAHEGLVDILSVGLLSRNAGFYYVMELADDWESHGNESKQTAPLHSYSPHTLRSELNGHGALTADEVINLGVKLAGALAHLHAQGLVHRDVKPSNILFIGGEPKLADAGLVTAMDDAKSLVGTAGYIAPEGPGTPQADLYALGKALYEVAFGKDRQDFPSLPADVALRPDHAKLIELNSVLLRACNSARCKRYQSADELRADLAFLHAGGSVNRRYARKQLVMFAWRAGLLVATLALCAIGYQVWTQRFAPGMKEPQPPEFTWSTNETANEEFRNGMVILHAGSGAFNAIPHFQRATELDPNFADAYALLARAWNSTGTSSNFANMRLAAEKAVAASTNCAFGYSVLASVKMFDLDWAGADKARKRALALAPNSEDVLITSAINLALMGLGKEALVELEKARRARPTSASKLRTLYSALVNTWTGEYDRGIEFFNRLDGGAWMWEQQSLAYYGKGDYTNAIRLERKAALARGGDSNVVDKVFANLERALHENGGKQFWRLMLGFESSRTDEEHWMRMAAIHARLEEPEKAFEYLRQAREKTPVNFVLGLLTNANLKNLRVEQTFRELVAELWAKK